MPMTPHVRCAGCEAVFASDARPDETVTCPECGHQGPPAGVMRPSGFPSLEDFRRNIEASRAHDPSQD